MFKLRQKGLVISMERFEAKADEKVIRQKKFTLWIYMGACAALAVSCVTRYLRGTEASATYYAALALLFAFMLYQYFAQLALLKRLKAVSLVLTEEGVSGSTFANILRRDGAHPNGETLSLPWAEVRRVEIGRFEYARKQPGKALVLETSDRRYNFPSIEDPDGLAKRIRARIGTEE